MSDHTRPDPRRPYKAITGAVVAGLAVALAEGTDILPPWATLLLAVLVAALGTFLTPAD